MTLHHDDSSFRRLTITTTHHYDDFPIRRLTITTTHYFDDLPSRRITIATTYHHDESPFRRPSITKERLCQCLDMKDRQSRLPITTTSHYDGDLPLRRNIFDPIAASYISFFPLQQKSFFNVNTDIPCDDRDKAHNAKYRLGFISDKLYFGFKPF